VQHLQPDIVVGPELAGRRGALHAQHKPLSLGKLPPTPIELAEEGGDETHATHNRERIEP
jgi:hypothetical protein